MNSKKDKEIINRVNCNISKLDKYLEGGIDKSNYVDISQDVDKIISKYSFFKYYKVETGGLLNNYLYYSCIYYSNKLKLVINKVEDDYYVIKVFLTIRIKNGGGKMSSYRYRVDQISELLRVIGILFSKNIGINEGYVEGGESKIDLILSNMKLLSKYENDKDLASSDFMNISDKFYDKILSYYSFFKNNGYHLDYIIIEGSKKLDITINCLVDDYYRVYTFGSSIHGYFGENVYILDQFSELIKFLKILFKESNKEKNINLLVKNIDLLEVYKCNHISLLYKDILKISDDLYNKVIMINSNFERGENYIKYIDFYKHIKIQIYIQCIEDDYYYVTINKGIDNCYYKLDQVSGLINFLKILFRGYDS